MSLSLIVGSLAIAGVAAPEVQNFRTGDVVDYPVVILRGAAAGEAVTITNTESGETVIAPAADGRFVGLAELMPGENTIQVRDDSGTSLVRIDYEPVRHAPTVAVVSRLDLSGSETEQVSMGFKLLQAATAELMRDAGRGRITFSLPLQADGDLILGPVEGSGATMSIFPNNEGVVNRPDAIRVRAVRHWPSGLEDAIGLFHSEAVLEDEDEILATGGKARQWALTSIAMGSVLQNVFRMLGYRPDGDGQSIVDSGASRFNRLFQVVEPPHELNMEPYLFPSDSLPRISAYTAALVSLDPRFNNGLQPDDSRLELSVESEDDRILVESEAGLRFIGGQVGNSYPYFKVWEDAPYPPLVQMSISSLKAALSADSEPVRVLVIDAKGNRAEAILN